MSVVEYDLDSSGGIMEQIQKLVAPPTSDEASRRSRRRNRTGEQQRRHGRAPNHDCCDSCKEGGDLLCCDRCPAAFHLLCHDPPLTEDELPPGEWVCHRCRVSPPEPKDDDAESTCSSRSGRSSLKRSAPSEDTAPQLQPPQPQPQLQQLQPPQLQPQPQLQQQQQQQLPQPMECEPSTSTAAVPSVPALPTASTTPPPPPPPVEIKEKEPQQEKEKEGVEEKEKPVVEDESNPFHMLIKAAKLMNPVQFELSKDIACTTPIPGTSKRVYGRYYKPPKKQAHELDNGLVPLPAKLCFTCTKSCRIGPLIQCDYCPLLFHMDCLNPPLTSLPTGRWMCPNHVEHFVDENMVRTNSLTERIKLWDKFETRVDQHAVKVNFLKHVHRENPPFRIKRRLPSRKTVSVPEAVKAHYKNPPPLLPLPHKESPPASESPFTQKTTFDASPEEQEQWLSSIVSIQTDIARYLTKKQIQKNNSSSTTTSADSTTDSKTSETTTTSKPTASVAPVVQRDLDSTSATSPVPSAAESASKTIDNAESKDSSVPTTEQSLPVSSSSSSKPASAISLLHGNLTSSGASSAMNGDAEILDVQKAKSEAAAAAIRTRSNSADAAGTIKVAWHGTDKMVGQPGQVVTSSVAPSLPPSQGKNIVISTINKANNTVVTKVLPSGSAASVVGGKVVLPPGMTSRNVPGSSPTSILSPRVLVQPSIQRLGSSPSQGTQTLNAGGSVAGTQTKVITVATSSSGAKTATVLAAPKSIAPSLTSMPALVNLNNALQQWIEGGSEGVSESELSKLDEKLLQLLAYQRLQQLLPPSASLSANNANSSGKKGLLNGLLSPGDNEVRSRAVLSPLAGKGQSVPMPFRSLSLGTSADMDVQLLQFGHCNFVSSKHAVIFYDEMTRHFELLNYSEFGTTVDNVLYSCDFSDKPVTTPQPSPVVAAVREIIGKNKNNNEKEKDDQTKDEKRYIMSAARSREPGRPCSCKASSLSLVGGGGAGWEGTAVLHHGSYIRVGCLQFVFSIVDQAAQDVLPPPPAKQPEQMSLLKTHLKAAH